MYIFDASGREEHDGFKSFSLSLFLQNYLQNIDIIRSSIFV